MFPEMRDLLAPLSIPVSNIQARESVWPSFNQMWVSDVKDLGQGWDAWYESARVPFSECGLCGDLSRHPTQVLHRGQPPLVTRQHCAHCKQRLGTKFNCQWQNTSIGLGKKEESLGQENICFYAHLAPSTRAISPPVQNSQGLNPSARFLLW